MGGEGGGSGGSRISGRNDIFQMTPMAQFPPPPPPRFLMLSEQAWRRFSARHPYVLESDGRRFTTLICAAHSVIEGKGGGGVVDEKTGARFCFADLVDEYNQAWKRKEVERPIQ